MRQNHSLQKSLHFTSFCIKIKRNNKAYRFMPHISNIELKEHYKYEYKFIICMRLYGGLPSGDP